MASTREERLQMRQRGAGTHKTKEIDFGFSFGGAAIGPSDSAALPLFPEPKQSSQTETAPPAATPPSRDSQVHGRIRRTPRSARNELPERPSPYDIPVNDGPSQRSNKRRKLSSPSQLAAAGNRFSTTAQNGDTQAPSSQSTEAPVNETLVPATQPATSTDGNTQKEKKQDTNGAGSDPVAASESPQNATIPERPRASRVPQLEKRQKSRSPQQDEARPARRRSSRQSSSPAAQRDNQTSTKDVQRRGDPNAIEAIQSPVADASASAGRPEAEAPRPITAVAANDNQTDQSQSSGDETRSKPKRARPRNARGKSSQSARDATLQKEPEQTQEDETRDELTNTASQASSKQKRGRRRRSPAQTTPDLNAEEGSPEAEAGPATAQDEPQSKSKRPRRKSSPAGKKATAETEARPEKPAGSSAAAGESSRAATRRGRKASKKRVAELQPEIVEPELEEASQELEPEPEVDAHPETEAAPSRARRGRPNKGKGKNKRAAEPEEAPSEEQPDPAAPQEPPRKTRESRGDTVPVTIHRLANASALGAMYASAEGSGNEDDDSPDGLLSRLNTKLPSRGGVNPADVLSQICRETLEKTLEKLKTGIEIETNAQKRAEWSRKRKAVEAFGLELDNRLLDLSEILDSNFVLGMQLRKAKRDMMELRSHLYKVRKERESIAIQMDAVRAKHMEEENAKTARNTINNSLHSLELALDRSQHRAEPSTEVSPADLEFMLRTVADDVSCRAPGAQGGLLNQIRALNHQLEVTARRLERS